MKDEDQRLGDRWMKVAGVVTLYWFISISMVFLNKYLLSSDDLKLNAPLFLTLTQCIVATLCFMVLGLVSFYYPNSINFPQAEFNLETTIKVLPLSIVFVGMLAFNNLTLKYLGIAFYNVGRSLTTVFNVSLTYVILKQSTSWRVLVCCSILICGFLLGLKEEEKSLKGVHNSHKGATISIFGVVSGILASLCVALYAILTKKVLPMVGDNIWRLQFYNNLNAVVLLSFAAFWLERHLLYSFKYWSSPYFWCLMLVAGIFGIAIGYVTSLQIQVTSPLTHNVSGTAKACAQTILACMVFFESKSFWWWLSNVMVLGGSSSYTYVRMSEMKTSEMESKKLVVFEERESDAH